GGGGSEGGSTVTPTAQLVRRQLVGPGVHARLGHPHLTERIGVAHGGGARRRRRDAEDILERLPAVVVVRRCVLGQDGEGSAVDGYATGIHVLLGRRSEGDGRVAVQEQRTRHGATGQWELGGVGGGGLGCVHVLLGRRPEGERWVGVQDQFPGHRVARLVHLK